MSSSTYQLSWAINTKTGEGHGFLGRYWLLPNEHIYPPTEMPLGWQESVYKVRLFETRREAREALRAMKARAYVAFPKATVERVSISTESLA